MAIFLLINQADPTNPNSYTLAVIPPTCSSPKNRICYIVAANDGSNRPIIDCNLIYLMFASVNSRTDSSIIKLKP